MERGGGKEKRKGKKMGKKKRRQEGKDEDEGGEEGGGGEGELRIERFMERGGDVEGWRGGGGWTCGTEG